MHVASKLGQLVPIRQTLIPQQEHRLLERALRGQLADRDPHIFEDALLSVDIRHPRLGGDHALQPLGVVRHGSLPSGTLDGLVPAPSVREPPTSSAQTPASSGASCRHSTALHSPVLIPLGTDRPLRRPSVIAPAIIIVCTLVFIFQRLLDTQSGHGTAGFTPRFWVIGGQGFAWYRTLTYNFLHGDLLHLLGNMLFLWVFGRAVEDKFGRIGFLLFYLGGGVFAGLVHALFAHGPAIGASGAISAVTGAFLVMFPRTRIKVLWFLIIISLMLVPAWFFIGLQVAWNIIATGMGEAGNVATLAHLGGYVFGFVVSVVLLWLKVVPREPYDLFTISRQAKRRREILAAGRVQMKPAHPVSPEQARRAEALAKARAAVSTELSAGRPEAAIAPYRELLEHYGESPEASTLSRTAQYQLGLQLYASGENAMAIRALS
ncbi:MAG TPA: rhomboid family intramembrane serine protease, partial [Phycisphaerales bacterium]|nr:rhomboid family intramembrane serine protease [Phycisphaerales bacterium]